MSLAIVIPYYKRAFFRETLESLANQANKNFTVYIGNDASLEDPEDVIEEYASEISIVYKKFDENLGSKSLVKQWERCLRLVQDEKWVCILGDDDVFDNNVVTAFYNNIEEVESNEIKLIRYATTKIDAKGVSYSNIFQHPKKETSIDFLKRKVRSSLSEYVFNKNKLFEVKFKEFPLGWSSDKLAVLEVSDFSWIYSINEAIVRVRITEKSISGNDSYVKLKLDASFQYHYYLLKKYRNKFSDIQYTEQCLALNKCYLNSKKYLNRYFLINLLYLKYLDMSTSLRFHVTIIKSILAKFKKKCA